MVKLGHKNQLSRHSESQSTDARVRHLQQKMTLSSQQVLSYKYQYQYQYQRSKYQYKYLYSACKYKYKYQYPKIVLKYSTSTSTQYNKTAFESFIVSS